LTSEKSIDFLNQDLKESNHSIGRYITNYVGKKLKDLSDF